MEIRRDVFQAIADPTRREILGLIAKKPMTPNSVADSFAISRQAISKHIKILTECGLLSLKIQGRDYYYAIQPKKLAEVNDWLEQFRQMWEARFDAMEDLLSELQTKKPNPNNHP
jgi:DNA-binding transcriptional ArsR family regulator